MANHEDIDELVAAAVEPVEGQNAAGAPANMRPGSPCGRGIVVRVTYLDGRQTVSYRA